MAVILICFTEIYGLIVVTAITANSTNSVLLGGEISASAFIIQSSLVFVKDAILTSPEFTNSSLQVFPQEEGVHYCHFF